MGKNKKNIKQDNMKTAGNAPALKETAVPPDEGQLKKRNLGFLALGLTLALFLFLWLEPSMQDFKDPWYKAISLVDSSRKVTDTTLKNKLLEEGGEALKKLALEHPYHARLHFFLGAYYYFKKDWDNVIKEDSKAIEIGSGGLVNNVEFDAQRDLLHALFFKGNELSDRNQLDSSIIIYERAIEESSKFKMTKKTAEVRSHVAINLSVALMMKGDEFSNKNSLDSAIFYYEKSVAVNPKRADALNNIGALYSKKNDPDKALEYFNKALQVDPENKSAMNNINAVQKSLQSSKPTASK